MNFEIAKEKAIKYIGISKKTEYEVVTKLKNIGVSEDIIQNVICYLKDLEYINDSDYVDAYIRHCMRLQKYSIFEISQKLIHKGIDKELIDEKLSILHEENYEKDVVERLLEFKLKDMEDMKIRQYLYRRGFKYYVGD